MCSGPLQPSFAAFFQVAAVLRYRQRPVTTVMDSHPPHVLLNIIFMIGTGVLTAQCTPKKEQTGDTLYAKKNNTTTHTTTKLMLISPIIHIYILSYPIS